MATERWLFHMAAEEGGTRWVVLVPAARNDRGYLKGACVIHASEKEVPGPPYTSPPFLLPTIGATYRRFPALKVKERNVRSIRGACDESGGCVEHQFQVGQHVYAGCLFALVLRGLTLAAARIAGHRRGAAPTGIAHYAIEGQVVHPLVMRAPAGSGFVYGVLAQLHGPRPSRGRWELVIPDALDTADSREQLGLAR